MGLNIKYSSELKHYGIKGQKWGIRRFQNEDGSLTPEGIKRYGENPDRKTLRRMRKEAKSEYRKDQTRSDNIQLMTGYVGGARDYSRRRLEKESKKLVKVYEKGGYKGEAKTSSGAVSKRDIRLWNQGLRHKAAELLNKELESTYAKWDKLNKENYNFLINRYGDKAITKFDKGEINIFGKPHSKYGTFTGADATARNTTTTMAPMGNGGVVVITSTPKYNYSSGKEFGRKTFKKYKKGLSKYRIKKKGGFVSAGNS